MNKKMEMELFNYKDFKKVSMKASKNALDLYYKFMDMRVYSKTQFTKKERELFIEISRLLIAVSDKAYKKDIHKNGYLHNR